MWGFQNKAHFLNTGLRSYRSLYLNPLSELNHGDSSELDSSEELRMELRKDTVMSSKEERLKDSKSEERGKRPKLQSHGACSDRKMGLEPCRERKESDSRIGFSKTPMIHKESRALLHHPLPRDIECCTCYIVQERSQRLQGASLYSLYTDEGRGRENRKLAIAKHQRKNGRSHFILAQNLEALKSTSSEGFHGTVTANLMGTQYHIWDQETCPHLQREDSKKLLAIVMFRPTIATLTGSFRRMRAYIPKHQMLHSRNPSQMQNSKGLPKDWKEDMHKVHQLFSKSPSYNKNSKCYELDFRERSRSDIQIQASAKNFQLVMQGENGRKCVLLLGKIGKSKYVMDYRFPLSGYQALSICLASIDSKLCCSL
ncbi:tubby-like protein 4 [Amborella trichopoda]|uniref:tubby-like protein 4 n=1 Tax=Amborella trichopoda TaxID=13333 RepID=UPI0005D42199|nr:tubby-like protein 4 [Amborella trichopoda]|eukprot:XP_006852874.2 tubby-like protein 4 [Amborella trichopoda]